MLSNTRLLLGIVKQRKTGRASRILSDMRLGCTNGLRADLATLGLGLDNSVLLQLVKKRFVFNLQRGGGLAAVPAAGLQRIQQKFGFGRTGSLRQTIQAFGPFGGFAALRILS